jgi:hypothetical protein
MSVPGTGHDIVGAWKLTSLEEALKTPAAEGDPNQPMRVPSARD